MIDVLLYYIGIMLNNIGIVAAQGFGLIRLIPTDLTVVFGSVGFLSVMWLVVFKM